MENFLKTLCVKFLGGHPPGCTNAPPQDKEPEQMPTGLPGGGGDGHWWN